MSGDHFHVHGPHDHEVEHAAEHGAAADGFPGRVAVMTAILATVGALMSYMGGLTQAEAALDKNNAAIQKTAAANQWNYYQAKSTKQNLAEYTALIAPAEVAVKLHTDIERYAKEKADIKTEAEKLEAESREWDERSAEEMHQHHRWAQATTALQVGIALSAIALITRRSWLMRVVYGFASIGAVLGAMALAHL